MSHPYEQLPPKAFWRSAVGERDPLQIDELWTSKFAIGQDDPVATLGSCFAQHIGRALAAAGYDWIDSEPAPLNFPEALREKFHYGVFSARIGNLYTVALLRQWLSWAFGVAPPSREIWRAGDRVYDPFRPNIEPEGFASETELFATRDQTLRAVRRMFETCSVFIFTLGLTEAWSNARDGNVYPICPGTIAGEFSPKDHRFHNYAYGEIHADLIALMDMIRAHNPSIRFLLTVSPVPLTATASADHVLVATTYSKSILRAVAGEVAATRSDTDYFPSFEIISGFPFKGMFYQPNMRSVTRSGVDFVMRTFFRGIGASPDLGDSAAVAVDGARPPIVAGKGPDMAEFVDPICEDMLLDAFGD